MTIVTITEAKNRFYDLINLAENGENVVITRDNKPKIKLVVVDEKPKKRVFGQHISAWEIMIKTKIDRLQLEVPLTEMIEVQQADNDLKLLPVELHHVYALESLPLHHREPFDRLLIAQAIAEQMFLVSADSQFDQYPVDIIW